MCYLFCCSTMHATLTLCHFCLFYSSICRSSAPLCPSHVEALKQHDTSLEVSVLVQPSGRRIFSDAEYEHPGAIVRDDLQAADAILGAKQVEMDHLLESKRIRFSPTSSKAKPRTCPCCKKCCTRISGWGSSCWHRGTSRANVTALEQDMHTKDAKLNHLTVALETTNQNLEQHETQHREL
jgi:hypothetical protein